MDVMTEPERADVDKTGFSEDADPGAAGDFADEHSDTTFADEVADGPEHARDPDEPEGREGLD
ncbi:hypothetical protein HC031_18730 [Planosporangium thailandense]|uniref:Autophagy-related protein 2 n=1 Tax=Planosporangium thailandense TaxID=765197 RepID=A0ABX0Y2S8_9ACTN|nr:hypothetical protein [Planosporangium thailandense]NJC71739.1 hypothetical protein [Planosporangium thailandense]